MKCETIETALKEWAVVERSLLDGRQILLLRKGGIIEDSGEFKLEATEFLLMPTYEHAVQRPEDIKPQYRHLAIEEMTSRAPESAVRFRCASEVTDTVRIEDPEKLSALSACHIWSADYLSMRVDWEPYRPLFALIVRAYRLPEAVVIPFESSYSGCRSWIKLTTPIAVGGAMPVLSDAEFDVKRTLVLSALGG